MLLGGLVKFTLSDYPGKLACIVFTQGCNFRCLFCHNGHLLDMKPPADQPMVSEQEFFSFLNTRKGKLDGVVITGGEPTLHRDLEDFIRKIKGMGFLVKLDTNGSKPAVVKHLLEEKLIDMVAIDVKTSLQNQEAYDRICGAHVPLAGVRETIDMVDKSGVCYQLRTTVVPALHTPTDLEDIANQIPAGAQWKQQKFIPENALDESLRTPKQMADA